MSHKMSLNVEYNITKRWESGTPHHPKSLELYKRIEELDFQHGGDFFNFSSGGDGDNGEHLMYLMDIFFEEQDANRPNEPTLAESHKKMLDYAKKMAKRRK